MNKKKEKLIPPAVNSSQTTEQSGEIDFDELVAKGVDLGRLLDKEHLASYNYDELKEIVQYVDPIDNPKIYQLAIETIRERVPRRIRIATIGHRIWSFYYERYLARIFYVGWFLVSYLILKPSLPGVWILGNKEYDKWFMVFLGGLFLLFNLWHVLMAFLESNRNIFFHKTTYFRRNLGIYVVDRNGKRIGIIKSILRSIFKTILIGPIMILSMEYDTKGRGIHDKLLGTYVLRITSRDDIDSMSGEIAAFISENY